MSYKRTLAFFVLFVALAAFYYFYEVKGKTSREEGEKTAKLLLPFKTEDATTLILKKQGEVIVAEKNGDNWSLKEPIAAPAEKKTVTQALRALSELRYERDLGPQADLQSFGLSEPAVEIDVKGTHGDIGELFLGAPTPDGDNLYVKKSGDQKVYTVAKSAKSSIDKNLFDLRDKSVLDFPVPEIKGLAVSIGGQTVSFEGQPDDRWLMTLPEKHPADADKIRRLLDSIRYASIQRFVEEDAPNLEKYGLSNPRGVVELSSAGGKKALFLGNETAPKSAAVYASRDDRRQVFQISAEILKELSANVDDWRDKHLVWLEPADVARMQIETQGGRIVIERSAKGFDEWNLVEPQSARADKKKVEDLLSYALEAKAIRFLKKKESRAAETALKNPLITLTLWNKDNKKEAQLSFAGLAGKQEVCARASEIEEFSVVNEQLVQKLSGNPDELKDRSALSFDPASTDKIEVAAKGKSFAIKRKGEEWKVARGAKIEPYEVDQFLWDLRDLRYMALSAVTPNDKTYGFDSPTHVIKLWQTGAKDPLRLVVGKRAPERRVYYVQGNDEKQIMEIEDSALSKWLDKF